MVAIVRLTGLITLITPDVDFAMLSCDSMGFPPYAQKWFQNLPSGTISLLGQGAQSSKYYLYYSG